MQKLNLVAVSFLSGITTKVISATLEFIHICLGDKKYVLMQDIIIV
jgi:hypothetical protein